MTSQKSVQARIQGMYGCWWFTNAAVFFQQSSQEGKISSQALLLEQAIISAITAWALKE